MAVSSLKFTSPSYSSSCPQCPPDNTSIMKFILRICSYPILDLLKSKLIFRVVGGHFEGFDSFYPLLPSNSLAPTSSSGIWLPELTFRYRYYWWPLVRSWLKSASVIAVCFFLPCRFLLPLKMLMMLSWESDPSSPRCGSAGRQLASYLQPTTSPL